MARGHNAHRSPRPQRHVSPRSTQINKQPFKVNFQNYINIGKKYFKKAYSTMNDRYLAVFTILLVVILTFLLPDISSKIQKTNELKAMKNTLDLMATEVNRAEVACLTVADNLCSIKNSMRDDQTETARDLRELSVCTSNSMQDTQSEPVQIEKKIGLFRRIFFPHRNASHKEIAIMSFLYSDSFATQKEGFEDVPPSAVDDNDQ
ncbi:uncharacterized protein [Epargyreus clarus]|uniref:uncharacterized protein isoform X1 n=1 Tax=Epargyreus clarus TaxID=520877 RepID=UPI003C2BF226